MNKKSKEEHTAIMLEDSASMLYGARNLSSSQMRIKSERSDYSAYEEWCMQELSTDAVTSNIKEATSQIGDSGKWLTDEEVNHKIRRDLQWLK